MRTKTLLIAVAGLALGVATSMAQTYSQNVVGYVNVVYPAGQMIMSCNPLTTGNDVITNVIVGAPGASYMYYWTGSSWASYQYSGAQHKWKNGAVDVSSSPLAPGTAYFINAASAFTNTYVGTCVANAGGGTCTNYLSAGVAPVGSLLPYSDVVTNTGTFDLLVPGATTMQIWDPVAQAFQPAYQYFAASHNWKQGSTVTNPIIQVGQGFFISPPSAVNWVQTLQ